MFFLKTHTLKTRAKTPRAKTRRSPHLKPKRLSLFMMIVASLALIAVSACSSNTETTDTTAAETTADGDNTTNTSVTTATVSGTSDGSSPNSTEQTSDGSSPDNAEQPNSTEQTSDGSLTVSDDVPDIEMTNLATGTSINLRSVVDGDKPMLFWFWAPHCPVCRREAPLLEQLSQKHSDKIKIVGIGTFDDLAYAERFVDNANTTFTMLWSSASESWRHYNVNNNSYMWFLDAQGNRIGENAQPYNTATVEEFLASDI